MASTEACSDFADKRDSQCLEQIVELTEENLKENGIELEELLADGGYSSGRRFYLQQRRKLLPMHKTRRQPSETAFQRRKKG